MDEPLEESYFRWLCAKIIHVENPTPTLTYDKLLRKLHNVEFVWMYSGDDNRAADGVGLRDEFLNESRTEPSGDWHYLGCSVFEMFVAFSRRAEFETDIPAQEWFWTFIENLDLLRYNDAHPNHTRVEHIISKFIWRTYGYDGHGGMFPLDHPERDQTRLQVWYQFCDYLIDNDL